MACWAGFNANPYTVLIAVGAYFNDVLSVAACCAFVPEFLTAAGPVMDLSCFYGFV